MFLNQGRDQETVNDARLTVVLQLRAGVFASERIPDEPEARAIERSPKDFCGCDGLYRHLLGAFEVAHTARDQGPAGYRRGHRRQERCQPIQQSSQFDKDAELRVMHLPEQLVPSESLLVPPGDQALKDTVIGAGKHLCLTIGDEEIDLTCCPRCHRMKTHGGWLLQQVIHLLGQSGGLFPERCLNGVWVGCLRAPYRYREAHDWQRIYAEDRNQAHQLRTRIKRLVRRTMCFSQTATMHDLVSGLFSNRYAFGLLICYGINRSETPSGILSNLFCTNELKRL